MCIPKFVSFFRRNCSSKEIFFEVMSMWHLKFKHKKIYCINEKLEKPLRYLGNSISGKKAGEMSLSHHC